MASFGPRVVARNVYVESKSGERKKAVINLVKDDAGAGPNFGSRPECFKGYNFTIYASFEDIAEVVFRVEHWNRTDDLVEGKDFEGLFKKVSFSAKGQTVMRNLDEFAFKIDDSKNMVLQFQIWFKGVASRPKVYKLKHLLVVDLVSKKNEKTTSLLHECVQKVYGTVMLAKK
jgi:hypothetical protein